MKSSSQMNLIFKSWLHDWCFCLLYYISKLYLSRHMLIILWDFSQKMSKAPKPFVLLLALRNVLTCSHWRIIDFCQSWLNIMFKHMDRLGASSNSFLQILAVWQLNGPPTLHPDTCLYISTCKHKPELSGMWSYKRDQILSSYQVFFCDMLSLLITHLLLNMCLH